MGYMPWSSGFTRLTSSGVVSDSGKSIAIYGVNVESGATAAKPWLANGTAVPTVAGTCFPVGPNAVSQGNINMFQVPIIFAGGCYVSFDANTTSVTVYYSLQATS